MSHLSAPARLAPTDCTLSVPCAEGTRVCRPHGVGRYNVILFPDSYQPVLEASEVTWSDAWRVVAAHKSVQPDIDVAVVRVNYLAWSATPPAGVV